MFFLVSSQVVRLFWQVDKGKGAPQSKLGFRSWFHPLSLKSGGSHQLKPQWNIKKSESSKKEQPTNKIDPTAKLPNTFIPDVSQPTQYEDEKCEMGAQEEKKGESDEDEHKQENIPELIPYEHALERGEDV